MGGRTRRPREPRSQSYRHRALAVRRRVQRASPARNNHPPRAKLHSNIPRVCPTAARFKRLLSRNRHSGCRSDTTRSHVLGRRAAGRSPFSRSCHHRSQVHVLSGDLARRPRGYNPSAVRSPDRPEAVGPLVGHPYHRCRQSFFGCQLHRSHRTNNCVNGHPNDAACTSPL